MVDEFAGKSETASGTVTADTKVARPIIARWTWFRILFVVFLVTSGAMIVSNLHAAVVVPALFATDAPDAFLLTQAYIVDYGQVGTSIAFLASYFACAIAYACFMARSIYNARLRYPDQVKMSPHGYWLWHIVPFASLYKPVNGMVEAWHALHPGGDGPTTPLIPLWWGFWVAGSLVGIGDRLFPASQIDFMLTPGSVDAYVSYQLYGSALAVIIGLSAFFLLRLASQLKELQLVQPAEIFA